MSVVADLAVLDLTGVSVQRDDKTVLHDVTAQVVAGQLVVIVGPNGAGKSTLLSAMAGDLPVSSGSVTLDGRPIESWQGLELARRRAVLTQDNQVSFGFTVSEVVAMGRFPWNRRFGAVQDAFRLDQALAATDTTHLKHRNFRTLSGGERARVSLARVLAQDTELVFLDEPTAALDLRHTEEVLRVASDLVAAGRTVVVVAHDLSLASAYADVIWIVDAGRLTAAGPPRDVLTPEVIERTYQVPVAVQSLYGRLAIVPLPNPSPQETSTSKAI